MNWGDDGCGYAVLCLDSLLLLCYYQGRVNRTRSDDVCAVDVETQRIRKRRTSVSMRVLITSDSIR